ncbi:hypothetical protein ACQP1P_05120 [Dactylosporangium sp. CA-052675]|uniref:hypothetical protein n=1 Tax=Dactylosporangium sp. CA-052675 TaxID=3239927 RepID=UPI003D8D8433
MKFALVFAAVVALLLTGSPAHAGALARDDGDGGMQIQVVVSGNPETTTSPTPGGGDGGGKDGNGGGGGLARTGLNVMLIAGAGIALVALGATVRAAARRRSGMGV